MADHAGRGVLLKNLVIFGASYFDVVKLIDAVNRANPAWHLIGFLDDTKNKGEEVFNGYRVLGGKETVPELSADENTYFFNNVTGHWSRCKQIADLLGSHGCKTPNMIHPLIDMNYVKIGRGCIIPEGCVVGGNTRIGDFVTVRLQSLVSHDVVIEDYVFIGPGVTIGGEAVLKRGCFIGAGATVMGKTTVHEGSVVGAGTVVIRDVPPDVTVVGVPAREIKRHADR